MTKKTTLSLLLLLPLGTPSLQAATSGNGNNDTQNKYNKFVRMDGGTNMSGSGYQGFQHQRRGSFRRNPSSVGVNIGSHLDGNNINAGFVKAKTGSKGQLFSLGKITGWLPKIKPERQLSAILVILIALFIRIEVFIRSLNKKEKVVKKDEQTSSADSK